MRGRALGLAGAVLASLLLPRAAEAGGCAPPAAGGEWRSYGHDLRNTRSQPEEDRIGPDQARSLRAAAVFSPAAAGASGGFQSTPIVADGCVYVATDTGAVFALDADDLSVVWRFQVPAERAGLGGLVVGAPGVHDGLVLVLVNRRTRPYVLALDQATGARVWETVVEDQEGAFINASAVIYDDLLFVGISGNEADPRARGGFAVVELREGPGRGTVLRKTYTIPDADHAAGYAGGSVWTTAAVDEDTGYAYVGGGNPASKRVEHRHTNALLKVDLNRASPRFGEIVDAYKGNVDQYYPGLDRQPACALLGDHPNLQLLGAWSLACLQLDLDFGASPNLFVDALGHTLVGALQKSGVYHAVYADTMEMAWTSVLSVPCFACNASSGAHDGSSIYAVGAPAGQMVALAKDSGAYRWASPVADVVHYQAVTVAGGVVYTVDTKGFFDAYDAATGVPLLHRPLALDVGSSAHDLGSGGVAVARHTVYAAQGEFLVAYRP